MTRPPDARKPAAAGSGAKQYSDNGKADSAIDAPLAQPAQFLVVIHADRVRLWGRYASEATAAAACSGLRRYGFDARILVKNGGAT